MNELLQQQNLIYHVITTTQDFPSNQLQFPFVKTQNFKGRCLRSRNCWFSFWLCWIHNMAVERQYRYNMDKTAGSCLANE